MNGVYKQQKYRLNPSRLLKFSHLTNRIENISPIYRNIDTKSFLENIYNFFIFATKKLSKIDRSNIDSKLKIKKN
jgi:hypothetical protein